MIHDPVTIEVTRHKLEGIADEMQSTLLRTSFSPIVKEGLDASAGLYTAAGETLAQSCSMPVHLATLIPALARIIRDFPPATMQDGDAYLLNDPYCGGSHLPDIAVLQPIFAGGRVIAFAGAMTHHQDMGGMSAGSVPTNATEIFQEGLRIPPLLLRRDGVINATLEAMIRLNVRIPDTVMGDLHAQLSACAIGARRVGELAARLGDTALTGIFAELLDRSERMTRQALAAIPDGTYHHVDWLDNDGITLDRPIRIEVAVTIDGDSMHCDFTGTDAQLRGPLNCMPSGSHGAAYFAVRALTDPAIPTNGGCFRPVTLHLPEGSLLNPRAPAPVNARASTIKRVAGTIVGAMAQALPDRVPAAAAGQIVIIAFGGRDAAGKPFVTGDLIAGGSGAGRFADGVDVIETDISNCMNLPAEAAEMETPIRLNQVAIRRGSGGDGAHRGGLGTIREYEALVDDITFTHRGERHFSAPPGLFGGGAGAMSRSVIHRRDGREEVIASKLVTRLQRGDRVVIETAGGGGYGAPAERDAAARAADRVNRKV